MRSSCCGAVITRGTGGLWPAALGTSSSPRNSQKPEATKANSPNATTGKSQRARDTGFLVSQDVVELTVRDILFGADGCGEDTVLPPNMPDCANFSCANAKARNGPRLLVSADSDETVAEGETDWRSSFLCSGIPAPEATLSVTGAVLAVAASSWEENTPFVIGCSVAGISPERLSRTRKSATFSRLSTFSFRTCRIFSGRAKVHPPVLDNLYSAMGYVRCACQSTSMDFPS